MDLPPYNEFLKQLKINLWLLGIPYGNSKLYFRFYILVFSISAMMIEEITFFVSRISLENFLELTQLAPCICIGVLSILKISSVCSNRRKIFKLSKSLDELYNHILTDTSKMELVKYELCHVSMLMKYFFVLNAILIGVYNFLTLALILYDYLTTNEIVFRLPYAVLLPFSTDAWIPWAAVYIHSVICGFICVLFYTTVDGLYFVMTSHVCGNFRIISDKVRNLKTTNVDELSEIVKSHQYILKQENSKVVIMNRQMLETTKTLTRLGEDLEDIFKLPNLFNVLVGSLEICALGFNLTKGSWEQVPGSALFIISILLQILMMSVFGENMIRDSTDIGRAAYLCDWYKMDNKSKKTILTIMIRSHKAQRLTAYNFSTISYGSFTTIISTSWSYFTILRTVYTSPDINRTE